MNAPWQVNKRATSPAQRDAFAAFVCNEATAESLRPVILEMGWQGEKIHKGGLRNAIQTLAVSASPQILLVDLSECSDPLTDINALAEVCEPGTIVIAIGQINDVILYRDLIASGIQDYVLNPIHPEIMRESLLNAQTLLQGHRQTEVQSESPHQAIAIIGARGGVGASSIASSLAWEFSEAMKRKTALLDLDIQFGIGALSFDLEPGRGLTDALENPGRIDSLFIERAIVKVSEKLAVLSAEAPINTPLLADGSALYHLQDQILQSYESVIIDLPRLLAVQNPHLLTEISQIVLVTDLTLAAARDTIRLLGFLTSAAPGVKIRIVANKVPSQGQSEVSRKDFEASIERSIDHVLPLDVKQAITAAKQGQCLAQSAKGSKTGSELRSLANVILKNEQSETASESFVEKIKNLGSLFSKKKDD